MVEMQLSAVRVELPSNTPILLLQEARGANRTLPIYIGPAEAQAIAFAQQGVDTPRPMTHDLMRDLLEEVGATVECIVITELRDRTFYAEIRLLVGGQRHISLGPPVGCRGPRRAGPHHHLRRGGAPRCRGCHPAG